MRLYLQELLVYFVMGLLCGAVFAVAEVAGTATPGTVTTETAAKTVGASDTISCITTTSTLLVSITITTIIGPTTVTYTLLANNQTTTSYAAKTSTSSNATTAPFSFDFNATVATTGGSVVSPVTTKVPITAPPSTYPSTSVSVSPPFSVLTLTSDGHKKEILGKQGSKDGTVALAGLLMMAGLLFAY